jgi:hypothetical protein
MTQRRRPESRRLFVFATSTSNQIMPDKEFLLSALRAASLRAKLTSTEMDSIGVALKRGLVSAEEAIAWLHDENLIDHVIYRPFKC